LKYSKSQTKQPFHTRPAGVCLGIVKMRTLRTFPQDQKPAFLLICHFHQSQLNSACDRGRFDAVSKVSSQTGGSIVSKGGFSSSIDQQAPARSGSVVTGRADKSDGRDWQESQIGSFADESDYDMAID
jgi:hypothetical protein